MNTLSPIPQRRCCVQQTGAPCPHPLLPLGRWSPWLCRERLCLPGWGQSERSCVQVPARVMCTRGTLDLSHRYLRAQHLPAARLPWGGNGRPVACSSSSCCYQRCQRAPAGWAVPLPWLKSCVDTKNPSTSLAEMRLGQPLCVNVTELRRRQPEGLSGAPRAQPTVVTVHWRPCSASPSPRLCR